MSTPSADAVGKENGAAVVENGREDDHPAAAMQNGGYESERRAQRRQRHELEKEEAKQWDIIKSMSDISAEVELLTQEVARIRHNVLTPAEQPRELTTADRQVLAENHKRRVAEIVTKQCAQALKHVQNHKWAFPFNEPVELDRYPDYLKAVSEPMDFGTVKARMDSGAYVQPGQFNTDMRLVFGNARKYNPPGSDVYHMAGTLLERYDEKWNLSVVPKVIEEELNCKVDEESARKKLVEAAQREAGAALEAEGQRLQEVFASLQERIRDAKSLAAAACKPMPLPEKARLVQDMQKLNTDHFDWATSIVLARYPGAVQGAGEELGLDISQVDALTLRQLQHYVHSCFNAGDSAVSWPGCLVGSGVSAFQAPGKRHKAGLQEGGAKGGPSPALQLLETPRPAGLPHLKVPTPGMGGAQATMESSTAAPFSAALAQAQNVLQGPSNAMPAVVSMQDGFKVPLPRRPGSLPVTPRAGISPAAGATAATATAAFVQDQAALAVPVLTPHAVADTTQSGGASRLATMSVGGWNGAPCTEDDPLRGASSGVTEADAQAGAARAADGQQNGTGQTMQRGDAGRSAADVDAAPVKSNDDGMASEELQVTPMETDAPEG